MCDGKMGVPHIASSSTEMTTSFQLPQGVCTIIGDSGTAFTPAAGYTMQVVSDQKWTHVCRAACSVDQLTSLIAELVDACLPSSCYAILTGQWTSEGVETYLSDFGPREDIAAVFALHIRSLLHDGSVGHGFACYNADRHEEIFIDDHKELTVLTSAPLTVAEVFARHCVPRDDGLQLLSWHAHAHVNLTGHDPAYCQAIIQALHMRKVESHQ